MKAIKNIIAILAVTVAFTSCTVSYPILATEAPVGDKVGTSEYKVILGFLITDDGDASIQTAAENAGIERVATVDAKISNYLFFTKYTTIVAGE